jgi:hypothetical protein
VICMPDSHFVGHLNLLEKYKGLREYFPGMRESIREGMETDLEQCSEDLDW